MIGNHNQNLSKKQAFLSLDAKILSKMNGRVMGIDYGTVRIGIALSDLEKKIATPFKIIHKLKEIDDLIVSKNICAFVVGLPLQTDGQEGKIAELTRLFCARLIEKYALPVVLIDERYTSKFAAEYMTGHFVREQKQKQTLDAVAAARILQKALDKAGEK